MRAFEGRDVGPVWTDGGPRLTTDIDTPKLEFVETGTLARSTHKGKLLERTYQQH